MWKRFLLGLLMVFVPVGFWGCEVVVGPPHGRVVVGPAPPPPVMAIPGRPKLVFIPDHNIYVAVDVDHYLFYDGSIWFYFDDGAWYRGKDYNGPWVRVKRGLPPGLVKTPPGQLRKLALKEKDLKDRGNSTKTPGARRFDDYAVVVKAPV